MRKVCQKTLSFIRRYWRHLLLALVLLLVYRGWFSRGPLTYGDWGYHSHLMLTHYVNIPFVWEPAFGLGKANLDSIYFMPQHLLWGLLAELHFSFALSERLIWFFPSILIAVLSSYYLGKTVFRDRQAACITAATFTLSTYFLRITTQGSVAIGTSIALTPLVLALLLRATRERGLRYPVLAGLALLLQGSFDLRFCYLTILIAVVGWILLALGSARRGREGLREAARRGGYLALAFGIFIGASMYWILPNFMGAGFQIPSNYGQSWWISQLSFGNLAHGFVMQEPGWPALPFTKLANQGASPVNPFFILVPVIGFGAALFALRRIKRDRYMVKVALAGSALVLAGTFLEKGSNGPLGGLYVWMFNHVPGFNMFRDSNKMFLFIILGYSILFGLAALIATEWVKGRSCLKGWQNKVAVNSPVIVILLILCLLALPALSGHLGGAYSATRPVKVSEGYKALDRQLEEDPLFYRTFWYPDVQRFATKGLAHPAVSANELFTGQLAPLASTDRPTSALESPLMPGLLDAMSVKKLIVPEDSDLKEFQFYRGEFEWEAPLIKQGLESLAKSLPGNTKPVTLGGNLVLTRNGGKGHVFIPEKNVCILGGWNAALAAHGAPGLDLNSGAYYLSEQGNSVTPAFSKSYPTDTLLSGEPTFLDTVMPFVSRESLIPVAGAAAAGPNTGWASLPSEDFLETATNLFRAREYNDRSLDYGAGGAHSFYNYMPPAADWPSHAKLIQTIDVSAVPITFFTGYEGLTLKRDTSYPGAGKATLRGSLKTVRQIRDPRIAYSDVIPAVPFHPYGIRFRIAGQKLRRVACKIGFYNSIGQWIGEKVLLEGWGTSRLGDVKDQFTPPANTAYCRFEVQARESEARDSSWNLDNVYVYDLEGLVKHPKMVVTVDVKKKGAYRFLARGVGLEEGGRIALKVDGGREIVLDTFTPAVRMHWFDLGRLELTAGRHTIEVTNLAGANFLNALALVTDKDLSTAEDRLGAATDGKDSVCTVDITRYPKEVSYSNGRLTQGYSVYCPAGATLTPMLKGKGQLSNSEVRVRIGSAEYGLSSASSPTSKPGWVSLPETNMAKGLNDFKVFYPVRSLVDIPATERSLAGPSAEWQMAADGFVLTSGTSAQQEPALVGLVPQGDETAERVAQSKRFPVAGNTYYSSLFTFEGMNCKHLTFALKVFDEKGKLLDRKALSDEMNGTFTATKTFKKVKLRNGARSAVLEVIFHANRGRPSSWKLSGLLLNETSLVDPPVKQFVMVPKALTAAGSGGATSNIHAEVLQSSPTRYTVRVSNANRPFVMVFSERYVPDWELYTGDRVISPVPAYTLLNSYALNRKGSYEITLKYGPQKWVNIGLVLSILTLVVCFTFLLVRRYRRKRQKRKEWLDMPSKQSG